MTPDTPRRQNFAISETRQSFGRGSFAHCLVLSKSIPDIRDFLFPRGYNVKELWKIRHYTLNTVPKSGTVLNSGLQNETVFIPLIFCMNFCPLGIILWNTRERNLLEFFLRGKSFWGFLGRGGCVYLTRCGLESPHSTNSTVRYISE